MKKSAIVVLVILSFLLASFTSQQTIWLDQNLNETSQENAVYYRVGNKLEGEILFYFKNKNIFRRVFFVDKKKDGKFYEYYSSGELREEGKYKKGERVGNWKEYYKNGKIKKKGRYDKGYKVGIWKVFYKND